MKQQNHSRLDDYKKTLVLAAPLIAAQLAQMGMEFVDTIMIGHIGLRELASAALSGVTYITVLVFFIGILSAVGVSIAREFGAKSNSGIAHFLYQGLALACMLSIPAVFIVWFIPNYFILTGQDPKTVELSAQYLHAVIWGVPGFLLFIALREFTSALFHPKLVMWIAIAAIPSDAIFNYCLIYGHFGLPALGIAGAGYATAIIDWLMPITLILIIINKQDLKPYLSLFSSQLIDWPSQKSLLKIGWPVGTMLCFELGLFSVTALMMGHFGTNALAAHQVAIQSSSIAFMFFLGISQAVAIRLSHSIGADNTKQAKTIIFNGLQIGLMFAAITAFCFYTFPAYIAHLFFETKLSNNQVVLDYARSFLQVAAIFQFFDALQVIMSGSLRGLKDTFVPMLLSLASYWIIGLSTAYLAAFVFQFNAIGLWWGFTFGLCASGLLLLARITYCLKKLQ